MTALRRLVVVVAAIVISIPLAAAQGRAAEGPQHIDGGTFADDARGMAAMHVNGGYRCSASIVAQYWVLTARHCVEDDYGNRLDNADITVRVKSIYRSSGGGVVQIATSRVRTSHDIAMLKTDRSMNAEPVRLATATTKVGETNYAFGWGTVCYYCAPSERLRRATQRVAAIDGVTDAYGGRAIKTWGGDGAVCQGDSGGPLFKLVDGKRYQVGVLSWGDATCSGRGDYFATVPDSRDWINYVMETV